MIDWHQRYTQQAQWTAPLRSYLIHKAGIKLHHRVLEVGCGSGAVLQDFSGCQQVLGLDIEYNSLKIAQKILPAATFICADAHFLPLESKSLDFTICHFFLMWANGADVIKEMCRITRSGGAVIAMAEPDYGGRIDHPPSLTTIGHYQTQSLRDQGADPFTGRKIRGWFQSAGLVNIECGVMAAQWTKNQPAPEEMILEWAVIRSDLENYLKPAELEALEKADRHAWEEGTRILFVPTFYAIGFIP